MYQSTQPTRAYPHNSPHAAGRLVALALISNGEINAAEWAKLCEIGAPAQLGLVGQEWHDIVDGLCKDLLATAPTRTSCMIDRNTMARWFGELDDRELQTLVILLSAELIFADGRVDPGESALLRVAIEQWGLPRRTVPHRQTLSIFRGNHVPRVESTADH